MLIYTACPSGNSIIENGAKEAMSTIAKFETLHINILTKASVAFFFLRNTPYFVIDF